MADELAAKRYARAAFELAVEAIDLPSWSAALGRIAEFFGRDDVGSVLSNTRVDGQVKQDLVAAGLNDLPPLALNFARLLVVKGRRELAGEIASAFDGLAEERRGIVHARATTAVQIGDSERQAISQRLTTLTGREVVLETEVDESILGGLVVQVGDRLIDGSTRSRLEALRASLTGVSR
jgi:F-type H+-transporting ATPase subunit delta